MFWYFLLAHLQKLNHHIETDKLLIRQKDNSNFQLVQRFELKKIKRNNNVITFFIRYEIDEIKNNFGYIYRMKENESSMKNKNGFLWAIAFLILLILTQDYLFITWEDGTSFLGFPNWLS